MPNSDERSIAMSETNKDLILRYQEAYNRGELDVLDEILDPDWVTNAWAEGIPKSIESAKQFYALATSVFPDLHVTTDDLIAEGDKVVQRWTVRGTHKGELMGWAPTGRQVKAGGISIFRIAEGRIVEHLAFADELCFLQQLGADVPAEWLGLFGHRTP
jgi:predicted ester cyclase